MLQVLFEDNHLLIINKPAGIPVQKDETQDLCALDYASNYLVEKYQKPGKAFVGLIHRLDRPVSGVLALAKTSKALERMNHLFRMRETQKWYHAIVDKELPEVQGVLTHFLGKNSLQRKAIISFKSAPNLKESTLNYQLKAQKNQRFLYQILLESGRFHQIRAQLSKTGSVILGDVKYGAKRPLPDKSIALHAHSLSFIHPVTKKEIAIEAPYPSVPWWNDFV